MNARQFFELVSEMRYAQQNYFNLRKQQADKVAIRQALDYSISLEGKVDAEIFRVNNIINQQNPKQL